MLKTGIGTVAAILFLGGCGQEATTETASTPADAEAPYRETPTPPVHADVSDTETLKSAPTANTAAFNEAAAKTSAPGGKVSNVTADSADKMNALKSAAVKDDAQSSPDAAVINPFGGLVGDDKKGRRLFAQCQACHSVNEGQNRVGPSLYNIVGSPAGAVEGFRYSDANATAGIVWTEDALFAFLENPRDYMPGTRMIFNGLPKPQDRADIVAYLKLQSGE